VSAASAGRAPRARRERITHPDLPSVGLARGSYEAAGANDQGRVKAGRENLSGPLPQMVFAESMFFSVQVLESALRFFIVPFSPICRSSSTIWCFKSLAFPSNRARLCPVITNRRLPAGLLHAAQIFFPESGASDFRGRPRSAGSGGCGLLHGKRGHASSEASHLPSLWDTTSSGRLSTVAALTSF